MASIAAGASLSRKELQATIGMLAQQFEFIICEFSDKILVQKCNGIALAAAIEDTATGILLGGRCFGQTSELSWQALGDGNFRVVFLSDDDAQAPDGLSDGGSLSDGTEQRVFLWGRPAWGKDTQGKDVKTWYEPRVDRLDLPLEWKNATDTPVATIVTYKRGDGKMPVWRFKSLEVEGA